MKTDVNFNVSAKTISNAAEEHREDWNLDDEWMNSVLYPAREQWNDAWAAYQNPATRTPLITFAKKEARRAYEKPLRMLVKILQSSPKITDDDRRAIGITIPSTTRTPAPPPTTYPDFTTDSSMIRRLTVHFRDHGSTSSAKPKGVHGAEIRWAIIDPAATPNVGVANLSNSAFDTRTPFMLEFNDSERGKTVYLCLRWENTRGVKGPWSEIVSAIVP